VIEGAKSQENHSRGKIGPRRPSGSTGAEGTCQPQMNHRLECVDKIGGNLPRRKSTSSGSRAHRPRGRRSDQLRIGRGKRLHWVARWSTLSCSSHLGIGAESFARLRDEVLFCGCCDDYEIGLEHDDFGLDVADAAGYERHRRRWTWLKWNVVICEGRGRFNAGTVS
jgi:hypothetical protein